jgi:GNAT superfamily N-acetyltransferase
MDAPRVATLTEVASVAGLLDAFNREFDTPTPGKAVLAARLGRLLAGGDVIALLTGDPAVAVALLTLRPNVWYDGPVALLDELYVAPELRGRGLGSALLAAAEAVTRQHGGELLEINVDGGRHRRPPLLPAARLRQQRAGRGSGAPLLLPGTGKRDVLAQETSRSPLADRPTTPKLGSNACGHRSACGPRQARCRGAA